ncbi:MAG: patatin-like phospholipase family protein [bacterium]
MLRFLAVPGVTPLSSLFLLHALLLAAAFSQPSSAPVCARVDGLQGARDSVFIFVPRLGEPVGNPHYFIPYRKPMHARVGLAFSGGGARSLTQIGVLQALEENNIPIDFIVGTSMGSVVGGLYAAGYNAQQLRDIMKTIDWGNLLTDAPPRQNLLVSQKLENEPFLLQLRFRGLSPQIPRALTGGQKLHSILTELTWRANYWASSSFDILRIPFRAVATDLYSGREIVIDSGDLSEAMCASSALPLLLAPVLRQNTLLIDGGVKNNIPVDVARRQGMDIVIGVDATSNLLPGDQLVLPWQVADQVTTIMQQESNEQQRQIADVVISFKDLERTSLEFGALDSLIVLGHQRTMEKMPVIQRLLAHGSAHKTSQTVFVVRHIADPRSTTPFREADFFAKINGATVRRFTAGEIQSGVEALYATGRYHSVRASLLGDTLALVLQENPRLQSFEIIGNTVYPDSVLLGCMHSRCGEAINHQQGHDDLRALVEHYRRDGYALAQIRSVTFDSANGNLRITIDEGRIGAVELEGLRHTQPFVVQREFALKSGEIFNSKHALQGLDNIHSTGLFEKVSLTPVRQDTGGTRLKIKLEERPSGILRMGGYYQSERGTYGLLEIGNENMFGSASKLYLHGTAGSRGFLTKATWRTDRVFSTFLTFSANAYLQSWDNFVYPEAAAQAIGEYQDRRLGIKWTLGQQVGRFASLAAEMRWENLRLSTISGTGYPTGESDIFFIAARSVVDTRDRLPFPRTGRYANISYEYAKPSDPKADSFIKFLGQLESFHALGPHVIHPKFIGGIADATTPFSEQFRLSGPTPVFGLRDQELIGRNLVVASLEYRYQLRKRPLFDIYFGLRYDLSGIWQDRNEATVHEFRHALGLSVTADTPLFPIGIAFGWLERWQKRVYFNVGIPF